MRPELVPIALIRYEVESVPFLCFANCINLANI